MRGTVLQFSIQTNQGFISGDDNKRYRFVGSDWNLSIQPEQGIRVDFDVENNQAILIYEDPTNHSNEKNPKSRISASLMSLFLGSFGIQFFYLEAWGWGLLSIIFCWTYIPTIAGLILGIRYLCMSDKEFEKKVRKMIGKPFGSIDI